MNVPGWTDGDLISEPIATPTDEARAIANAIAAWGQRVTAPKPHVKQRHSGGNKIRAGYTKNHGHGQSKARRQMAKASKRRNRVKL